MNKFLAVATMAMSVSVLAFLGGTFTAYFEVFPYPNIRDAVRTFTALIETQLGSDDLHFDNRIEQTAIPAIAATNMRWKVLDASAQRHSMIVFGGLNQYLELCPDQGCLAVTFDSEMNVIEAWPYRPADIFSADITNGAYPHEMLTFDPSINAHPHGVKRYANGDILATFQSRGEVIFPFALGVARVGPDGAPIWSRFDFSHHWTSWSADEIAYVPGLKISDRNLTFVHGAEPSPKEHKLKCESGRPQLDTIQMIDGAGVLVEEIELAPIFLRSNWAGLLPETTDFCDPLHLNFIDEIGGAAGPGLAAGDLVLSLRNLSRFAIFDPKKREIKRVVSGGFVQQHSVQHLSDSKFLIFDNRGGDAQGPASRIVELDLATGVERRIFPNAETPESYAQIFSDTAGYLDISPDRSRVLASFTHAGRAFEIDIATGRLLMVFDNVHNVSEAPDAPAGAHGQAVRFPIYGISYVLQ